MESPQSQESEAHAYRLGQSRVTHVREPCTSNTCPALNPVMTMINLDLRFHVQ